MDVEHALPTACDDWEHALPWAVDRACPAARIERGLPDKPRNPYPQLLIALIADDLDGVRLAKGSSISLSSSSSKWGQAEFQVSFLVEV